MKYPKYRHGSATISKIKEEANYGMHASPTKINKCYLLTIVTLQLLTSCHCSDYVGTLLEEVEKIVSSAEYEHIDIGDHPGYLMDRYEPADKDEEIAKYFTRYPQNQNIENKNCMVSEKC